MRIQHNIMAMNAYRNYTNNTSALSKNLERLSSGYKINRAGDDAAGLAISEKMRAQITGLEAAQKNVKDGVSLVNTAEGAMQEIQDMLNRMVSLATQSANGTYDNEVDRKNLQAEVDQLKSEINRIADSANFNGIKLLDGSLDTNNTTGRTTTLEEATTKAITLPDAGTTAGIPNTDMIGDKTVLKKDGTDAAATEFSVNLRTLGVNAENGDEMVINIGSDKVTIKFDDSGTEAGTVDTTDNTVITVKSGAYTADEIGDFIKAVFNTTDPDNPAATIGGQAFKVDNDGGVITFTQLAAPAADTEVVDGALEVSVEYTSAATNAIVPFADAPTYELSGEGAKVAITDAAWASGSNSISVSGAPSSVTISDNASSGLDETKILAALNATDASAAGEIEIKAVTDENGAVTSLGLYAGTTLVGTADLNGVTEVPASTDSPASFEFKAADGTSLGSIDAISASASTVSLADAFGDSTNVIKTGLETDSTNPGLSATIAGTADLATALADQGAADGDSITVQRNTAGDGWEISAGGNTITALDTDADFTSGVLTLKDDAGTALMTITLSDTTKTVTDITGATALANGAGFDTGLSVAEKQTTPGGGTDSSVTGPTGQYEGKTTLITNGNVEKAKQLASTTLVLDQDVPIADGATLKIGDTEFVFKVGAESTVTASGENQVLIDLSAYEADSTELIDAAGEKLSQQTASGAFDIGYESSGHKLGIFEQADQEKYSEELTTKAEFEKLFSTGTIAQTEQSDPGKALALQIGDTSDSYNQLEVSVGDMHVDAMVYVDEDGNTTSISEIDISNQEGAQKAIDVIKNAINYVSSVRGTLGALSNRLDHTANNLSVMAENITDAESTIRDTDIAEEMMAYTKNNILVQSAQAMLAQANQVPQGVLQLLQ